MCKWHHEIMEGNKLPQEKIIYLLLRRGNNDSLWNNVSSNLSEHIIVRKMKLVNTSERTYL
jgi:hypothetical protein